MEQVKKYYDYLIKQQELCIKWINEALEKKQNIKTLNARYEIITSYLDSYKYYFKDYLSLEEENNFNSNEIEELEF